LHGGNVEEKLYEALRDVVNEHFKDTGVKVLDMYVDWNSEPKISRLKLTTSKHVYQKDD
jgi:hypothetical protein